MASNTRIISGSISPKATTVTDSATAIPSAGNLGGRRTMLVQNRGSASMFVGGSAVTASTGVEMAEGDEKEFQLSDTVTLYGITASGTSDVRTLEGY